MIPIEANRDVKASLVDAALKRTTGHVHSDDRGAVRASEAWASCPIFVPPRNHGHTPLAKGSD